MHRTRLLLRRSGRACELVPVHCARTKNGKRFHATTLAVKGTFIRRSSQKIGKKRDAARKKCFSWMDIGSTARLRAMYCILSYRFILSLGKIKILLSTLAVFLELGGFWFLRSFATNIMTLEGDAKKSRGASAELFRENATQNRCLVCYATAEDRALQRDITCRSERVNNKRDARRTHRKKPARLRLPRNFFTL